MFAIITAVEEVVVETGKFATVNANSLYVASSLINDRLLAVRRTSRLEDIAEERARPVIEFTPEELAYLNRP
jgi:hypothetical protein